MDNVLEGFSSELLKIATRSTIKKEDAELRALYRKVKKKSQRAGTGSKIRGQGRKVSRDYLASALIGAAATPAALLLGGKVSRVLHNKEVRKAMSGLSGKRKKAVGRHLELGPTVGKASFPKVRGKSPVMTHSELGGQAARGAAIGSIIQVLRDRFSGSAGKGDKR